MGIDSCRHTGNPCFSNSYSKQLSYALSSSPGPTAAWTFIAAAIIAVPISFSVTPCVLCAILRVLCVKAFLLREEFANFGEELAGAEGFGNIAVATGFAGLGLVAGEGVGGYGDDRHPGKFG